MNSKLVTVVVANFNYARYIETCLRSLEDQTLPSKTFEIIVIDDGSSDGSPDIVANMSIKNLRLIPLQDNLGLSAAVNLGIRSARGRYIVRVDSDDYVHPEFLKILSASLDLNPDWDAAHCDYVTVSENGKLGTTYRADSHPIACGIIYRKECFTSLGLYDERLRIHEDVDFADRFKAANLLMGKVSIPLYRYRKHGHSLTDVAHDA